MLKEISEMQRTLSIGLAAALALSPTFAFANSKTYNFTGSFVDYGSLSSAEYALASKAAGQVCPGYGNWTDSFQSFEYTLTEFDDTWKDYSATGVHFSVTCNWQQVNYTFSGAAFNDQGSVQDGENAIENDYWQQTCGDSNHQLTNMHFNSFEYIHEHTWWGANYYSATSISGSFTCDEG